MLLNMETDDHAGNLNSDILLGSRMLVSKNDRLETGGEAQRPRQRGLAKRFQVRQVIPENTQVISSFQLKLISKWSYLSAAASRCGVSLVFGRGDP